MIYKLIFEDKTEFAQAKDALHLLKSYEDEYGNFQDIEELEEINEESAKKIMLTNTEYEEDNQDDMPEEISLFDLVCGDEFVVVASSEW